MTIYQRPSFLAHLNNSLREAGRPEPCSTLLAAGDEGPRKKPAPDIYNIALDRLGLGLENCIAFEDSL